MALPILPYIILGGYTLDMLALLRVGLALLAVYYYSLLLRRPEANAYQCGMKRVTFALFAIDGFAHTVLSALGNIPAFLALREISELGVAFTQFSVSRNSLRYATSPPALAPAVILAAYTLDAAGQNIDVLALASIALIVLSIRNLMAYNKLMKTNNVCASAKKLFTLSLLAAYTFQFVGTLLVTDMSLFVGLSETFAVCFGFYALRHAVDLTSPLGA